MREVFFLQVMAPEDGFKLNSPFSRFFLLVLCSCLPSSGRCLLYISPERVRDQQSFFITKIERREWRNHSRSPEKQNKTKKQNALLQKGEKTNKEAKARSTTHNRDTRNEADTISNYLAQTLLSPRSPPWLSRCSKVKGRKQQKQKSKGV